MKTALGRRIRLERKCSLN